MCKILLSRNHIHHSCQYSDMSSAIVVIFNSIYYSWLSLMRNSWRANFFTSNVGYLQSTTVAAAIKCDNTFCPQSKPHLLSKSYTEYYCVLQKHRHIYRHTYTMYISVYRSKFFLNTDAYIQLNL